MCGHVTLRKAPKEQGVFQPALRNTPSNGTSNSMIGWTG
jgi:hypothetical protein